MNIAESNELFSQLPESIRNAFYAVASKSDSGQTARQFFHTEIPDAVKSDPEGIDLLLNGGTVTVPVDTFEVGRASTGTDTVEYQLPDRDFSRVVSGENGGDYTSENVVLEDASINRSRQEIDMTDTDYQSATDSVATDAELISERIGTDAADVASSVAETSTSMDGAVITAAESADGILETVLEGVLPVTIGIKCAQKSWEQTEGEDMDPETRVAITALTGGMGVAATAVVIANPIGAACVAAYGTYKLVGLGAKLWDRYVK